MTYEEFINAKSQLGGNSGFDPTWMPDKLFDFQQSLTAWACQKGRAAIFADCGLGKTFMQLTWAENVARKMNKPVLVLTPLAVAFQTVKEGEKIGVEVTHLREGMKGTPRIVVTNYERLHYFKPNDFAGVVCDESSILKNFDGSTKEAITEFMRKLQYRLLCTATAAPNDYIELGTSSEALGELGYMDMLGRFFKNAQNSLHPSVYRHRGMDFHRIDETAKWRFRGHAEHDFWRWVCSWARAMRKPSDLGFSDESFKLLPLKINEHIVKARTKADGMLFDLPAVGLKEQRAELRRTVEERCEMAAKILNSHKQSAVAWCHLNDEGDLLAGMIPDSVQVSGDDAEEFKEETFRAFMDGKIRVLVTKPKIACFGLNFQHCHNMTYFPSHSYEQYYQAVRRFWRFGQKKPVTVDIVSTEGQTQVFDNLKRKAVAAEKMFANLVALMRDELKIKRSNEYTVKEEFPPWL